MGRAAITVNYKNLQRLIDSVESTKDFPNITSLCHAVSAADTLLDCCKAGHKPKTIHYGQVYLAIKGGQVTVKTTKGKRGATAGVKRNRKSRGAKFSENQNIVDFIANARKDAPEKYQGLIDNAEAGSTSAFVKLKCIQCFGYENGYKSCDANGKTQPPCGLYPLNLLYWPSRKDVEEYDPLAKRI